MRTTLATVAICAALVTAACGGASSGEDAGPTGTDPVAISTTTTTPPLDTEPEPPSSTASTSTTVPAETAPVPATDAAELAARIAVAEQAVRDPGTDEQLVQDASFELQVLYRQLARVPEWEPEVLAALPPEIGDAAWANAQARREFRAMHSQLSDTLPAWRIIEPAPADELLSYYQEGEATFGVPWEILAAVNLVETGMGRIEGYSVAGARGPMQFIPGTWEAFGEGDIDDPHDAIMAAARYLAHNGGGRGDIDNALFRYNNSNRYVRGVKHYAAIMEADPAAFRGFYHWQIVYLSVLGDVWLPVGYASPERVPVAGYLVAHPDHHLGAATN